MSGSAERAPVAELQGVVVRFGGVTALHGIDLRFEPGVMTAVLGPNGAGKTTAMRLLLGLLRPHAGCARLFGEDPRSRGARRRVGVMLQVGKVPDTLRVSEHIDTFRSYHAAPLDRATLIDHAGLGGLERRLFGTLSGGEKQRVLFALALAGDPALLFLDEPTVGLDVEARRMFWQRIARLRADGRAVVLTTHYIGEADALADRVVVLHRGRIVADGSPAAVKRAVAQRRITCVTRLLPEQVRTLPDVQSAERSGDTMVILTRTAERVVGALLAADPALHELTVQGVALEDAFLAVTAAHGAAA